MKMYGQVRSQKDGHVLRKRSEVPLRKSNLGPFASATGRERQPALPNMHALHHVRYKNKELVKAARQPLAVYQVCEELLSSLHNC